MLLQTFVQLHILLAATPGLVGWPLLLPATQALPAHVLYLAAHGAAEAPLYITPVRHPAQRQTLSAHGVVCRAADSAEGEPAQTTAFDSAPTLRADGDHPFPNTTRAP